MINGAGNNNIIIKRASNVILSGGIRNETIHGGIEFNKIPECPDADNLFGNKNGNSILSGDGDDNITGENGSNTL